MHSMVMLILSFEFKIEKKYVSIIPSSVGGTAGCKQSCLVSISCLLSIVLIYLNLNAKECLVLHVGICMISFKKIVEDN